MAVQLTALANVPRGGSASAYSPKFKGARRPFTNFVTGVQNVTTKVALAAATIDTASLADATNGFTIPAGVTKVRFRGFARGSSSVTDQWTLYKNGASVSVTDGGFVSSAITTDYTNTGETFASGTLEVVPGDTFDLRVYSGLASHAWSGWLEIEVVEGDLLSQ